MEDIYDDLENYNEIQLLDELKAENKELREKVHEYTCTIEKLQTELQILVEEHTKLQANFSSLLRTARAEVERKTAMITQINLEKDQLIISALKNSKSKQNIRRNVFTKREGPSKLIPKTSNPNSPVVSDTLQSENREPIKDPAKDNKSAITSHTSQSDNRSDTRYSPIESVPAIDNNNATDRSEKQQHNLIDKEQIELEKEKRRIQLEIEKELAKRVSDIEKDKERIRKDKEVTGTDKDKNKERSSKEKTRDKDKGRKEIPKDKEIRSKVRERKKEHRSKERDRGKVHRSKERDRVKEHRSKEKDRDTERVYINIDKGHSSSEAEREKLRWLADAKDFREIKFSTDSESEGGASGGRGEGFDLRTHLLRRDQTRVRVRRKLDRNKRVVKRSLERYQYKNKEERLRAFGRREESPESRRRWNFPYDSYKRKNDIPATNYKPKTVSPPNFEYNRRRHNSSPEFNLCRERSESPLNFNVHNRRSRSPPSYDSSNRRPKSSTETHRYRRNSPSREYHRQREKSPSNQYYRHREISPSNENHGHRENISINEYHRRRENSPSNENHGHRENISINEYHRRRENSPSNENHGHIENIPINEYHKRRESSPSNEYNRHRENISINEYHRRRENSPSNENHGHRENIPINEYHKRRESSPSNEYNRQRENSPSNENHGHRENIPINEYHKRRENSPPNEYNRQREKTPYSEYHRRRESSPSNENRRRSQERAARKRAGDALSPERKRKRTKSTKEEEERKREEIVETALEDTTLYRMLTSCQSPDYTQIDNMINAEPLKEIKSTPVVALEDPRAVSDKYVIDKNKESISTIKGRNVKLKLLSYEDKEEVKQPEAIKEKPEFTAEMLNEMCSDIGKIANVSVESGEFNKTDEPSHAKVCSSEIDNCKQTSVTKNEINMDNVTQKPVSSIVNSQNASLKLYKIPKKDKIPNNICDNIESIETAEHNLNNNIGQDPAISKTVTNISITVNFPFKKQNAQNVCNDTHESNKQDSNVDMINDLGLSDATSDNMNLSQLEQDNSLEHGNLNKEHGKHIDRQVSDALKVNDKLASTEIRDCKLKSITYCDKKSDIKLKFNNLFGDSCSLITPEDLGLCPVPISNKHCPVLEDAVDLNVEEMIEVQNRSKSFEQTDNKNNVAASPSQKQADQGQDMIENARKRKLSTSKPTEVSSVVITNVHYETEQVIIFNKPAEPSGGLPNLEECEFLQPSSSNTIPENKQVNDTSDDLTLKTELVKHKATTEETKIKVSTDPNTDSVKDKQDRANSYTSRNKSKGAKPRKYAILTSIPIDPVLKEKLQNGEIAQFPKQTDKPDKLKIAENLDECKKHSQDSSSESLTTSLKNQKVDSNSKPKDIGPIYVDNNDTNDEENIPTKNDLHIHVDNKMVGYTKDGDDNIQTKNVVPIDVDNRMVGDTKDKENIQIKNVVPIHVDNQMAGDTEDGKNIKPKNIVSIYADNRMIVDTKDGENIQTKNVVPIHVDNLMIVDTEDGENIQAENVVPIHVNNRMVDDTKDGENVETNKAVPIHVGNRMVGDTKDGEIIVTKNFVPILVDNRMAGDTKDGKNVKPINIVPIHVDNQMMTDTKNGGLVVIISTGIQNNVVYTDPEMPTPEVVKSQLLSLQALATSTPFKAPSANVQNVSNGDTVITSDISNNSSKDEGSNQILNDNAPDVRIKITRGRRRRVIKTNTCS